MQSVPVTKPNVMLIIDLIAYYVPKKDKKGKYIYSIYSELKTKVLAYFPSHMILLNITYGIITGKITIDENIKHKLYNINFS